MWIIYRDDMGTVAIDNIDSTIQFLDGKVYFSAGSDDFELYIDQIVQIGKEGVYWHDSINHTLDSACHLRMQTPANAGESTNAGL